MEKEKKMSVFETLNRIDCSEHTEQKNGLTYLSWPWAIASVKKLYPDVTYEVRHWDGKPYHYDDSLGYMVETSVTIKGETNTMWLPVMDGKNKAMKAQPYTYFVNYRGQLVEKQVEAATMFDINTAIMRCLVKNLAMFGLGLYIYAGEDLPDMDFFKLVDEAKTDAELKAVWDKYCRKYGQPKSDDDFCKQVVKKQNELKEAAEVNQEGGSDE